MTPKSGAITPRVGGAEEEDEDDEEEGLARFDDIKLAQVREPGGGEAVLSRFLCVCGSFAQPPLTSVLSPASLSLT
jgi:hypothetical protein